MNPDLKPSQHVDVAVPASTRTWAVQHCWGAAGRREKDQELKELE